MADLRLPYSRALASWDHDGLMAALADDVVIRVAVHDAPMESKQVADFLFGVLPKSWGDRRDRGNSKRRHVRRPLRDEHSGPEGARSKRPPL